VVIGSLNLLKRRLHRGETDNNMRFIDGALDGADIDPSSARILASAAADTAGRGTQQAHFRNVRNATADAGRAHRG